MKVHVNPADLIAFNAGVARARAEYEAHPFAGNYANGEPRACDDCGTIHCGSGRRVCWRCAVARRAAS
jgi:hypothetical protein